MLRKLLLASLLLPAAVNASEDIWITVGTDTLPEISKLQGYQLYSDVMGVNAAPAAVVRLSGDEQQLLSEILHDTYNRCPGYIEHNSQEEAELAILNAAKTTSFSAPPMVASEQLPQLLAQVQESRIVSVIESLSAFKNRFYTTTHGVKASNWIYDHWVSMAAARSDVTVEKFNHSSWPQDSVILTIQGNSKPGEVVVVGGHLDSTIGSSTGENSAAPGADDNASGIATFTEVAKVLLEQPDFKPDRTIKIIGYAAEEVGLKGSSEIAKNFKSNRIDVKGVLQLDMTNYQGSPDDFYFIADYTNATQNTFIKSLVTEYLPAYSYNETRCGYACSDHASWHAEGFPASMPSESKFGEHNPYIHTPQDTLDKSANAAAHAFKFAQLALAYTVEMAVLEPATNQAPVARFTYDIQDMSVTYNNTSTDDKGITRYNWNFGDGTTSIATAPTHTYNQTGTYTVSLTAYDEEGLSGSASHQVVITGAPCLASGYDEVAWSESTSYEQGDKVSYKGKAYEATWWSTGAAPDVYTNVWKLLGDDDGGDNCKPGEPPVAGFSMAISQRTVTLQNTSNDDKGITAYHWQFGDGQSSTARNPSHTYGTDGNYTITLKVTDADGFSDTASRSVTVKKDSDSSCAGTPWVADAVYLSGEKVAHKGHTYEARWWTTGDDPSTSGQWGVWKDLGSCQ